MNRVPGVFTDARFSKWEYDDPEDYPDYRDKNDVSCDLFWAREPFMLNC